MSIGETLAGARSQAGLTIADVSARTRIREILIRAIEHDDFDACGADFYARGHIRAIAAVVGADAAALIREYDAARPSARPQTLEDLPRRPAARGRTARPADRRRPSRATGPAIAVILMLAVIGFASYKVVSGTTGAQRLASSPSATRGAASGGPHPSAAPSVTSASATPSAPFSPTASPVADVTPVSASAFGPDGDNPQAASLALSGNPATPWHTDWYTTATFGNLEAGTGLLLDLGRTFTITGVAIRLGSIPGADFQLRAGTTQSDLTTVASDSGAGGLVRLRLSAPDRARYLLIWFTLLPRDDDGTYQADVSGVTATVTP